MALGVAGCLGTIGGDEDPSQSDPVARQTTPAPGGMRRLTARQYRATIEAIFGAGAAAVADPPEDAQLHGLDVIGGAELAVGDKAVTQYETSARAIASVVHQQGLADLLPCTPSGPADEACFASFARALGRLVWRRPLDDQEVARLAGVGVASATHPDVNDFATGAGEIISALLQSPPFIYAVEIGVPQPSNPAKRWLDDYELVTRLSLFLLGRGPDAELLDAAEQRDLSDTAELEALARELVSRQGAEDALAIFFDELYRLRELAALGKDPDVYPAFNPQLAASMRLETLYLINDVVFARDADARELFTADYSYVDARLASLYGMSPVDGFTKVSLPDGRAGLLGHASWLTRMSHPASTSPTRRGLFVRTALLCDVIPPPPPGVATELPPPSDGPQTKKQQLAAHQQDPQCASCHVLIDNVGLALEHYDGIGAYRDDDQGPHLDSDMHIDAPRSSACAAALRPRPAADPRSMQCLVQNLFRGSMGHRETAGEQASIDAVEEAFAASGYRIRELLVALAVSPAFRMVGDPK